MCHNVTKIMSQCHATKTDFSLYNGQGGVRVLKSDTYARFHLGQNISEPKGTKTLQWGGHLKFGTHILVP